MVDILRWQDPGSLAFLRTEWPERLTHDTSRSSRASIRPGYQETSHQLLRATTKSAKEASVCRLSEETE